MILARGAHRADHRTFGVTNFQPEIPQQIQHLLDNQVRPLGGILFSQKQEIDIRIGGQLTAPVPADSHQSHIICSMPCAQRLHDRTDQQVHAP